MIRLAFAAFFWRAFLVLILLGEFVLVVVVWPRIGGPGVSFLNHLARFAIVSMGLVVTPAFPLACVLAVAADLLVVLIVNPIARTWHAPRSDAARASFHLSSDESIVAISPARRPKSRRGAVGSLVLTDRRLWFFPDAWDLEPWSSELGSVWSIRLVPSPRVFFGLVRGWPGQVAVDTGPPRPINLVVPEPEVVCSWPVPGPTATPSRLLS